MVKSESNRMGDMLAIFSICN